MHSQEARPDRDWGEINESGGGLREAEHERGAVLLGDEAAELALGLLDRLEVVLAHRGVGLHHGC